jgi:hypothetical protein
MNQKPRIVAIVVTPVCHRPQPNARLRWSDGATGQNGRLLRREQVAGKRGSGFQDRDGTFEVGEPKHFPIGKKQGMIAGYRNR